jgi:hypothetical protein
VVDHLFDLRDLTSGPVADALDRLAVSLSGPRP